MFVKAKTCLWKAIPVSCQPKVEFCGGEVARLRAHLRDRREFLRYSAAFLATPQLFDSSESDAYPRNVNTNSKPSDLRITDLRVAIVVRPGPSPCPLIRIDTNQGVSGLGEVRDGASPTYALFLKSRLLGENPLQIDRLFRKIKQFGGHARQGGGVCAVEMALWDIAGKVYNAPVYQMLGGKRSEEHTSELQSQSNLVCRLL